MVPRGLVSPGPRQRAGTGAVPRWGQETTAPSIPLPPAAAPCHSRGSQGWGRQMSAGRRSSEGQKLGSLGRLQHGASPCPQPTPTACPCPVCPPCLCYRWPRGPQLLPFQVTRVTSSLSGFVPGSQVSPPEGGPEQARGAGGHGVSGLAGGQGSSFGVTLDRSPNLPEPPSLCL